MVPVSLLLVTFVGLGVTKRRLGPVVYVILAAAIVAYVAYAYHKPQ